MTEHKNIYSALCAAQAEFGKVQKGSTNPAFKSRYADLADVAGVVIPTLSAHGVAVLHYLINDDKGMSMRTEFVHAASESRVSCDVPLIVDKNNMQGMKSATTYAKRIGLESLSGVAPDTDDDGNAAAKAAPRTISADQFIALRNAAEEAGVPEQKICAAYGAPSLEQFPAEAFDRAMKKLRATIAAAAAENKSEQIDDEIPEFGGKA